MPEQEGADRVAALEQQMQELQRMLVEERERRREEKMAADTKVRVLESRLQEAASSDQQRRGASARGVPRVAGLSRRAPPAHRDVAVSTPRTSDHLFAALPSGASERPARKPYSKRAADPRRGVRGRAAASATDSQRGGASTGATAGATAVQGNGADAADTAPEAAIAETALQHSWDKFCFLARHQFTPQELSLISAETLRNLLDHYRVRDPVERAQVEAQWALLQEGKETVGGAATPRSVKPPVRGAIRQAQHAAEFNIDIPPPAKHLSRRIALRPEGQRPSNPNETTSNSALVRSHSATLLLRPRTPAPCNPNDAASDSTPRRFCFARAESTGPRSETPRGRRHLHGPTSGELTPRGIRTGGAPAEGNDARSSNGIRTNIDVGRGGGASADAARRGLRTFAQVGSPVREHRPSRVCTTPPHLHRQRLGTETLATGGPWPRLRPNHQPSRAPFATD